MVGGMTMLENQITLPVDTLNNGTLTNRVYLRYSEFTDRSLYNGPSHTLTNRETLGFYRTQPKPNNVDYGVAKSAVKLTKDVEVSNRAGAVIKKPLIGDVLFSVPVGATAAQTLSFRQELIAVIDHALAANLVDKLEV